MSDEENNCIAATLNRYHQLIDNFHQERNILFEYESLVAPKQAMLHALQWNEREQEDEISRLEEEIQTSNDELLRLKEEIGSKQQIITNAKISQSMRLAQISRLSGLSQPIELDHTYFFVDRFPHSNSSSDQRNHPSSTSVSSNPQRTAPISLYKTENLQKLGIMKTGEGVLLEGRLNEITKLLEGHIFSFSSIASTINLNPDNHVYNTPETVQLREQVEKNLREYEKSEERVLATVVEILTLRLQMIKIQRDAIESDHRIALLECKYEKEKKEMDQRMVNSIAKLRDNYSREYHQRDKQYDKELETLEKKIAKAISRYEEGTEKEKIREERLKEALEKATIKYEQLKSRHRLELEGYRNEAKGLKQRLKHLYQIIRNRERYSQRATRQSFPADLTTLWHRREADKEDEDEVDDLDYEQYDHLNRR